MAWIDPSLVVRTVRMMAMLSTAARVMSAIAETKPMPLARRAFCSTCEGVRSGGISYVGQVIQFNSFTPGGQANRHSDDAVCKQRGGRG